ncbi:MAG: TIGR01777 family oxidoreductase [Flavobacteriales bacterium]|nr:TIGR01777 family oxidoreductase [Flavobacteriales bacterium]
MANILITGGSGMLGTRLTKLLLKKKHRVVHVGRSRNSRSPVKVYLWNPEKNFIEDAALDGIDFIIHLAGENLAGKKWSLEQKQNIINSRIKAPEFLFSKLKERGQSIQGFFSASGINIYPPDTDKIHSEEDQPALNFIANVVVKWEEAAHRFDEMCRVACFRFGIILDRNEGALPKMAFPIQFGFGAAIGSGKQNVTWIHAEDAARCFLWAIENQEVKGDFNAIAPQNLSNKALTKAIAKQFKMPLILPNIPSPIIRLMFGEMSELLLSGPKASSDKLMQSGFQFHFPEIESALQEIYS